MVARSKGLGPEKDCAGECQQHIQKTDGLNLAVVKLTTVQMTKLPLHHKMPKIGMISFLKPVPAEDLYIMQNKYFSIRSYMCEMYT
jgi:hypothetical protein